MFQAYLPYEWIEEVKGYTPASLRNSPGSPGKYVKMAPGRLRLKPFRIFFNSKRVGLTCKSSQRADFMTMQNQILWCLKFLGPKCSNSCNRKCHKSLSNLGPISRPQTACPIVKWLVSLERLWAKHLPPLIYLPIKGYPQVDLSLQYFFSAWKLDILLCSCPS